MKSAKYAKHIFNGFVYIKNININVILRDKLCKKNTFHSLSFQFFSSLFYKIKLNLKTIKLWRTNDVART